MEKAEDFGKDKDDKSYIPHEITVHDILSRLPVKTIFRFRSVCKLWQSLPYDAKFVNTHLNRCAHSALVIVISKEKDLESTIVSFHSLDIAENGQNTQLMSTIQLPSDFYLTQPSCDGLVCLSSIIWKKIFVCNPSTQEVIQLPQIHFDDTEVVRSCTVAGFGLDPVARKYKVLCASQSRYNLHGKCFVFTLDSADGKWRQLDDIPYQIRLTDSAYLNGAVHWIIEDHNEFHRAGILSFHFHDEKYQVLPLPNCKSWRSYLQIDPFKSTVSFKVIGGCLRLITTYGGSNAGHWTFHFWTLKDYANHVWTHEFCVNIGITCASMGFYPPFPVDIKNRKVLFLSGKKLYSQDLKEEESSETPCEPSKIICNFSDEDELDSCMMVVYQANHVESLVSLNAIDLDRNMTDQDVGASGAQQTGSMDELASMLREQFPKDE